MKLRGDERGEKKQDMGVPLAPIDLRLCIKGEGIVT